MEHDYHKHEIALHFVETGLTLFLEQRNYLAALHLAGAAEEIFGKTLDAEGTKNTLKRRIEATRAIRRHIFGTDTTDQAIAALANLAKNSIKHMSGPTDATIRLDPAEEAFDMLERAIENYYLLCHTFTPNMERFLKEHTHAPPT